MVERCDADEGRLLEAALHELSEPLTALIGYIEAAQRLTGNADPGNERIADLLGRAAAQSRRAAQSLLRLRQLLQQPPAAPAAEP